MKRLARWLLLLALAGCGRPGGEGEAALSPAQDPLGMPPAMSQGTLLALGPHSLEATLDRRGDKLGVVSSEERQHELIWMGLDSWRLTERLAGDVSREELQVGRTRYRRLPMSDNWVRSTLPSDPEALRAGLDLWDQVIAPFGYQLGWRRMPDRDVQGRAARVYSLSLAPPEAVGGLGASVEEARNLRAEVTTPLSIEGEVWVDVATGNRLWASLEGRYVPRVVVGGTDPTDEVLVRYEEKRSLTVDGSALVPPDDERVVQPRSGSSRR